MTTLNVDLDRLARDFRAKLDSATAHIIAASVSADLNHSNGIMLAGEVYHVSQFVLDTLPDGDVHNRERFRSFHNEGEKQVAAFWRTFNLFLITRKDGTTATVQPRPAEAERPAAIYHHTGKQRAAQITASQKKLVQELLAMCGPRPSVADMESIAEQATVSINAVRNLRYPRR